MFTSPPERLSFSEGIHIWRFHVESADESVLSENEIERAEAYRSAPARATFVAGRSGVRRAGAAYSGTPAADLLIESEGKPTFLNAPVSFNLSHSASTVIAAFSGAPLGIDLEVCGRVRDFAGLAARFFHPDEARAVAAVGDEKFFLRLWTAKEAMLKLTGEGIADGLVEARPGMGSPGTLRGRAVHLLRFAFDDMIGALASFEPIEVKGWFQI
jgi:4'-phosphopantetheinyl transferase